MFKIYLTTFLLSSIIFISSAIANLACVENLEDASVYLEKQYGEQHLFTGRTETGETFYFFVNFVGKSWTVLFQLQNKFCTAPNYNGKIIDRAT
tara:strand:+ start:94 stop:375 length:282 start_codon:yes stop_codon:yes gene_type:complete